MAERSESSLGGAAWKLEETIPNLERERFSAEQGLSLPFR